MSRVNKSRNPEAISPLESEGSGTPVYKYISIDDGHFQV